MVSTRALGFAGIGKTERVEVLRSCSIGEVDIPADEAFLCSRIATYGSWASFSMLFGI